MQGQKCSSYVFHKTFLLILVELYTGATHDLSGSFDRPYVGGAVNCFFDYLSYYNKEFSHTDRPYYGKFCSIVQSPGTGKSRVLTEVRFVSTFSYMKLNTPM